MSDQDEITWCWICAGAVTGDREKMHEDWHREQDQRLTELTELIKELQGPEKASELT